MSLTNYLKNLGVGKFELWDLSQGLGIWSNQLLMPGSVSKATTSYVRPSRTARDMTTYPNPATVILVFSVMVLVNPVSIKRARAPHRELQK